jgi:hypothetical protein
MVDTKIDVATRSRDYSSKQIIPSLEFPPPPLKMTLQIEKPEPQLRILKGVLKHSTHNSNARAVHNYSIVEDLGQTPCAMSALEVLQIDVSFIEECLTLCSRSSRTQWLKAY